MSSVGIAAQPTLIIHGFMQAWEMEKRSPDYHRRREISERLTEERSVKKKVAHNARQQLVRARKIDTAIQNGMRDAQTLSRQDRQLLNALHSGELARVRDKADAAFGWNQQMRTAAGSAAGRLHPLPSAAWPGWC